MNIHIVNDERSIFAQKWSILETTKRAILTMTDLRLIGRNQNQTKRLKSCQLNDSENVIVKIYKSC